MLDDVVRGKIFSRHSRINPSVDIKYIGEELVRGEKYLQQQDSHEPSENF